MAGSARFFVAEVCWAKVNWGAVEVCVLSCRGEGAFLVINRYVKFIIGSYKNLILSSKTDHFTYSNTKL